MILEEPFCGYFQRKNSKRESKMHDDENHPKWWIFHFFIVLQAIQLPFWCIWPSWNFGENPTMMEYWAEVLKGGGEVNEIKWKFSRALDSPEARAQEFETQHVSIRNITLKLISKLQI